MQTPVSLHPQQHLLLSIFLVISIRVGVKWYFIVVFIYISLMDNALEKTLESPLVCKEIQPVHPKGDQSWVFIGRTDAEAETPILWPPDAKS